MIKKGDMFVVNTGSMLTKAINGVSGFWSSDGVSEYNHGGIIISSKGDTFEALRKLDHYHLDKYIGRPIMIVRPNVDESLIHDSLRLLELRHKGQMYPWWRLAFHIIPPLARRISYKGMWLVCSELCAKFAWLLRIRNQPYIGISPDQLADEWAHWREYTILYKGIWSGSIE